MVLCISVLGIILVWEGIFSVKVFTGMEVSFGILILFVVLLSDKEFSFKFVSVEIIRGRVLCIN